MKYVFPSLIALIFGLVGMSLFAYQLRTFYEIKQTESWIKQSAKIIKSEIIATKKNTKIYHIDYSYEYQGKTYYGDRVNLSLGSQNLPVPLQSSKLEDMKKNLDIWIDPVSPQKSIIDNTVPIKTIAFNSTFIIFPCFFGIAFICLLPYWFIKDAFGEKEQITQTIKNMGVGFIYTIMLFSPIYSLLFLQKHLTTGTTIVLALNAIVLILIFIGFIVINKWHEAYKKWKPSSVR